MRCLFADVGVSEHFRTRSAASTCAAAVADCRRCFAGGGAGIGAAMRALKCGAASWTTNQRRRCVLVSLERF